MHSIVSGIILAAGNDPVQKGQGILNTDIGAVITTVFAAVGVLVVIIAFAKSIKDWTSGYHSKAVQKIVGGLVAGAICFNLQLAVSAVNAMGGVLDKLVTSITNLVGG